MSHIPILPHSLWALLNFSGRGFLPNFTKEAMIKIIQMREVVIEHFFYFSDTPEAIIASEML